MRTRNLVILTIAGSCLWGLIIYGLINVNEHLEKTNQGEKIDIRNETMEDYFERKFDEFEDERVKAVIAKHLVVSGRDPVDKYWNYLYGLAHNVIHTETVQTWKYDERGNGKYTNDFLVWCDQNGFEPKTKKTELDKKRQYIMLLGSTLDERALELLETGVKSDNPEIVLNSVKALLEFEDIVDVDLIIEAANRQTDPTYSKMIAENLLYYDDPKALGVAEEIMIDEIYRQPLE